MTRNGLVARTALAMGVVLAVLLAGATPALAAGGAASAGGIGDGLRGQLQVLPVPLRLTVTVAGQSGPGAVVAVRGGGDQTVTVLDSRWGGGLRLLTQRAPLDGRLLVVNDSSQTLQITLTRGRTRLAYGPLPPNDTLSITPGTTVYAP